MVFTNVTDALHALKDMTAGPSVHQDAIRFLAGLDDCFEAENLVHALQNNDFGVRWEASNLLARMGQKALPAVLKAMIDPKRVGDSRLRESVVHIIHNIQDHHLQGELAPLLRALLGPASDVGAMREAYQLLKQIDPDECPEENEIYE